MRSRLTVRSEGASFTIDLADDGAVSIDGGPSCTVVPIAPGELAIDSGGRRSRAFVAGSGSTRWVAIDGMVWQLEVGAAAGRRATATGSGSLAAPMPATVVRIAAPPGATVRRGDTVLILEAMKMELPLRAPRDGTIKSVHCREGDLVQPGVALAEIE